MNVPVLYMVMVQTAASAHVGLGTPPALHVCNYASLLGMEPVERHAAKSANLFHTGFCFSKSNFSLLFLLPRTLVLLGTATTMSLMDLGWM